MTLFVAVAIFSIFEFADCQWGGGGGHWGGGGKHNGFGQQGYGYGSGICAGARQQQRQPQVQYNHNRSPEYGGFNGYHEPMAVQNQQRPVTLPNVDYRISQPKAKPSCSPPDTRDTAIFTQICKFPNEHTQEGCTSRGASLPSGTDAILSCKAPHYYSESGNMIIEVCQDGRWVSDSSKSLTCKSTKILTTAAPPPQPIFQQQNYHNSPNKDNVVDYVYNPVYQTQNHTNQPESFNQFPTSGNEHYKQPSYWNPAPSTPAPAAGTYHLPHYPTTQATTTEAPTTTTTTSTTTTTTHRPYYISDEIDWRNVPRNSNRNNGKCPPLPAKSGAVLECLSKTERGSSSGYLLAVSDCQGPQIPGTEATYKCQMYYEAPGRQTIQYRKCKEDDESGDGTWSGSDDGFMCSLECGKSNPVGRLPLITWGETTFLGQFPWHVALFIRDRGELANACGGTLISQRAILTAAHCVNLHYSSLLRDLNDVRVDLGRFHREKDDPYVQKFQVEKIVSHPAYNPWFYESDIAIIILKGKAQIGFHVRPICYPKAQNAAFDEMQLSDGAIATVVGWGMDESGGYPDELKSAKLRIIGVKECIESFGDSETGALLAKSTTFCAGNQNGTNVRIFPGVCQGDSGSGAYTGVRTESGTTNWYLQGLVSVGINVSGEKKCDPEKASVFTRISPYSDWIVRVLSENDAM